MASVAGIVGVYGPCVAGVAGIAGVSTNAAVADAALLTSSPVECHIVVSIFGSCCSCCSCC